MRVLIGCETSGVVRDAFIAKGHDAVSCDILPSDAPGPHIQADLLTVLDDGLVHGSTPPRLAMWPPFSGRIVERWGNQTDSGQNRLPPSDDRWKVRSATYPGIAAAMAEQWGNGLPPIPPDLFTYQQGA